MTIAHSKRPTAGWVYLASFVVMGLSLSMLGPALTYLRERAGVSKGDIGALFVAQALGYLIGSLLSGRLYDHGYGHRAVAGGLAGLACSALMIPYCTSVAALTVPFALLGAFAGNIDVGCNTLVVWHTRGQGSARLLNALHLFFGVGALASPLLVNRSLVWSDGLGFLSGLLGVGGLAMAVIVLAHETPTPFAAGTAAVLKQVLTPTRILLVISVFFFLYVGVEVGFAGWLKTYAEGIGLPGANAPTWLNTAFWLSFTLGRLAAVMLSRRLRSGVLLAGSCVLTVAVMGVMIVADGDPALVWITTILMGFAIAPQFATMIAYAEEHIALSGRATAWFVSAAGVGGLVLPFVIGQMLDRSGSDAMPKAVFGSAVAAAMWLLVVRRALVSRPSPALAATGLDVDVSVTR